MKIALVGGATGIGAATLKELRDQGHEVLVLDIQQPEADIQWIPLDLLDQASITGALAAAGDKFDGLCFVAGIPPKADNAAACLTINTLAACHFITGFFAKDEFRKCHCHGSITRRSWLAGQHRNAG